ncbi:hypothetical protein SSPSH_001479 [Salinisphaera shabanensis E1L3A]|uniref:Uncharacterized protein n=1 Tax=Salinisphaera shabanensis E1L3A TaxID=1033802 RepID=U2E6M3_9GAMM|nr:hypothetical protein SSPSH_001479 [Salinisphaera shabanensis E1L3A]
MRSQPLVAQVGRLRPQAVSRQPGPPGGAQPSESRSSPRAGRIASQVGQLKRRGFRHSRVHRTFCFALQRDPLSFACPNESGQRKRHPGYASPLRAEPLRCAGRRVRPELGSLSRSSDMLAASAHCAENPLPLCFSFAAHGAQYRRLAHSVESLRRCTGVRASGRGRSAYASLSRPLKTVTLSERQRRLPVFGPLWRSAAQRRRQAEQGGRMFERSEFPAAPLAAFAGRESMRSIDARQGVFSLGYFSLDKQREVPRTAVRNPEYKSTRTVDPATPHVRITIALQRQAVAQLSPFATSTVPKMCRRQRDRGRP